MTYLLLSKPWSFLLNSDAISVKLFTAENSESEMEIQISKSFENMISKASKLAMPTVSALRKQKQVQYLHSRA